MNTKYLIGTSGWNYLDWRSVFYPKNLAKNHWLEYYAQQFNTVEVNATFYRSFPHKTYHSWSQRTPSHFKFVVKAHRIITHYQQLLDTEDSIERCWASANVLQKKLGLILLQLPPKLPFDLLRLKSVLKNLPKPTQFAIEFRDQQWYCPEVKKLCTQKKVIFCNQDSPKIELTDWLTSSTAYIRLHGHKYWYDYNYSIAELKKIARLCEQLSDQGAKKIYIFFNNDVNGYAVRNALQLQEMLL